MYFNYPNEDLYEQKESLKNPKNFLKLLEDILSALEVLEKQKMVHGNLKPEYIYFNEKQQNFVLLDRLSDSSSPNLA